MPSLARGAAVAALASALAAAPCEPAEIFRTGSARLLAGGEASGTLAEKDRGYFNEHDYGQNALRAFRTRLTAELQIGGHAAALGELRHENDHGPRVYAAYVRVRPSLQVPIDVQAGLIPPVFGAYPRRSYAIDNPLIGEPLGYQYLTSLRADAAPLDADALLAMRSRGWSTGYTLGNLDRAVGLPAMNARHWDTGVQVRWAHPVVEIAAAVTLGSPSNPRFGPDDNDGRCLSARVAAQPAMGLVVGLSAAGGRYAHRSIERLVGAPPAQRLAGADLEYSRGRWVVRAEALAGSWDAPIADPSSREVDLRAWSGMLETRYKIVTGLSAAARLDRLAFADIPWAGRSDPWDYSVTRAEAGLAYAPQRHVLLKGVVQHNRRSGGWVTRQTFVAGQVLLWF